MKIPVILAVGAVALLTSACSNEAPDPTSASPSSTSVASSPTPVESAPVSSSTPTPTVTVDPEEQAEAAVAEWRAENKVDATAEDDYVSLLDFLFGEGTFATDEHRAVILDVGYTICWQLSQGATEAVIVSAFADPFLGQPSDVAIPAVKAVATMALCPQYSDGE
ncbi:DUF732 domain-containing protein [Demequina gelatinilytica]|uniref:DUF732 domain-containing protein n=1 Tax=Demequina gelatinilytica TaxID=1638980 RepID=UPI00078234FC|nr:DUF732 domain-containing protein [Demequina gelatinilytica]